MMLPVMSKGEGRDYPGGPQVFLKRRFRRIVPTYYMSLVLTLVMYLVMWLVNPSNAATRREFTQRLDPAHLLAHLLLVHNWKVEWAFSLNPPAWTISAEWHVYLLFAVLLLPAWRLGGGMVCVAAAYAVGMMVPKELEALGAWYPLLFAGGMCACAYTSEKYKSHRPYKILRKIPLGFMSLLFFALITYTFLKRQDWLFSSGGWLKYDLLSLACAVALFLHCRFQYEIQPEKRARFSIMPLLQSRFMVWVGEISYSLYITHFVTLATLMWMVRPLNLSPMMQLLWTWGVGVPASVAFAYGFYLKFERPFIGPPMQKVPPVPLTTEEANPKMVDVPGKTVSSAGLSEK